MARSHSAAKHDAILEAALAVFLDKGYLGTSMDEVAGKASVSKQTVYKHFADKDRLFAEIVLATTGEVERLVRWIIEKFDDRQKVEQTFESLACGFLKALMEPRLLRIRRLVLANADRVPQLGSSWYQAGFERVLATLAECFERLTAARVLRANNALVAANHFVGMLLWVPVNKAMFTGNEKPFTDGELDSLAKAAAGAFLNAYGSAELEQAPSLSGSNDCRRLSRRRR